MTTLLGNEIRQAKLGLIETLDRCMAIPRGLGEHVMQAIDRLIRAQAIGETSETVRILVKTSVEAKCTAYQTRIEKLEAFAKSTPQGRAAFASQAEREVEAAMPSNMPTMSGAPFERSEQEKELEAIREVLAAGPNDTALAIVKCRREEWIADRREALRRYSAQADEQARAFAEYQGECRDLAGASAEESTKDAIRRLRSIDDSLEVVRSLLEADPAESLISVVRRRMLEWEKKAEHFARFARDLSAQLAALESRP